MDKINGQFLSYYGFKLIKYRNLLNMPSRLGDVFFDWGNEIEPLVHQEDLFWDEKDIFCEVFFDGIRFNKNLNEVLESLEILKETTLETRYGLINVSLKEVIDVKKYDNYKATLTLVFNDKSPLLNNTLPAALGGTDITIDGYSFLKDFNIILKKGTVIDEIPELTKSEETKHVVKSGYSKTRSWNKIKLDCVIDFKNLNTFHLRKLQYLLSLSGLRKLVFKQQSYDCFLSRGFTITEFRNVINFSILLNSRKDKQSLVLKSNNLIIPNNSNNPKKHNNTHFGKIDVNTGYGVKDFIVENNGGKTLTISSVQLVDNSGAFSITQQPNLVISPNNSSTIRISFNPSAIQYYDCKLQIISDDKNNSTYSFTIAGEGFNSNELYKAEFYGNNIFINNQDLSPDINDNTDFGSVVKGESLEKDIILKNIGNGILNDFKVSLSDTSAFSIKESLITSLQASSQAPYKITFNPNEVKVYETLVQLFQGTPKVKKYEFKIKGNGIEKVYDRELQVSFSTTILNSNQQVSVLIGNDFGDLIFDKEQKSKIITLKDIGLDALNITSVNFNGSGDFSLKRLADDSNQPKSFFYEIKFIPTSTGVKNGTITIFSNDSKGNSAFVINLKGNGVEETKPLLQLKGLNETIIQNGDLTPNIQDGTDFQVGIVNQTITDRVFKIRNIGNANLVISNIQQTDSSNLFIKSIDGVLISNIQYPITITPNQEISIVISFKPVSESNHENIITLELLGINNFVFKVSGISVSGSLIVEGNNIEIQNLDVTPQLSDGTLNDNASLVSLNNQLFKIINEGTSEVKIKSIRLLFGYVFSIENTFNKSLQINTNTAFNVVSSTESETKEYKACVLVETDVGYRLFYVKVLPKKPILVVYGNNFIIDSGTNISTKENYTDFGQVEINLEKYIYFKIFNKGNSPLNIFSITSSNILFSIVDFNINTISSKEYCFLKLKFTTSSIGRESSIITINSNDEINPNYSFKVEAESVNHDIEISSNDVVISKNNIPKISDNTDFGEGLQITNQFKVTNKTNTLLSIQKIHVVQNEKNFTVSDLTENSMQLNEFIFFNISFSSKSIGDKKAEVILILKGLQTPISFNIKGKGLI